MTTCSNQTTGPKNRLGVICQFSKRVLGLCLTQVNNWRKLGRVKYQLAEGLKRMRFVLSVGPLHPQHLPSTLLKLATLLDPLSIFGPHDPRPRIALSHRQLFAAFLVSLASPLERATPSAGEIAQVSLEWRRLRQKFAGRKRDIQWRLARDVITPTNPNLNTTR